MINITPIHLPLTAGKEDDPLHYVRLKWRRFPGSLRLWRPAWTWADGQGATPSTLISLARSEPIKVETYELMGADMVLAFSRIASAEDALAFADSYGFLGAQKDTAVVSMGLKAISEMALEIVSVGAESYGDVERPVEILADRRKASDRLLILRQKDVSDATAPSIQIHSSSRDLRENVSTADATALLRRMRRLWPENPGIRSGRFTQIVEVRGLLVEPVSLWLEEASALNKLMDMWRAIQANNVKALGQGISPDGRGLTESLNYRSPFNDAREHVSGLKDRAPRDLLALAKEYLARALNLHLHLANSATFVCVDSNGNWKLHCRPVNMRAALWMQFSEIVTGTRKIRACEICGDLMDVTNNTRRKKVHDRCSQRECMQRYRRTRNGETGKQ
jgi:hypothetical protein